MSSPRGVVPALGVAATAAVIVAGMVGQGVFLKGRVMACEAGAGELLAWAIAGALALCAALSFAELATMTPQSGGAYVFVRRSFGRPAAFAVGWALLLIASPAAIGALATGAAIFFNRVTAGTLERTPHGTQLFAVAVIAVVTALNCAPVKTNGTVAVVSAIAKIVTLAAIAVAGFVIGAGHAPLDAAQFSAAPCPDVSAGVRGGAPGLAAAVLAALYALNGWIAASTLAGEIRKPATVIPLATSIAVSIVVLLYVAANAAFLHVLSLPVLVQLAPSASVGIVVAQTLFGNVWGTISSAILFVSVVATLHVAILAYSRITYAMAADEPLFSAFARVSKAGVPVRAVLATSSIAVALVLLAGFERLSDYVTFEAWLIYVIVVAGLFALRVREPDAPRPYRVTGYPVVPAIFLASATYVLVVSTIGRPIDAAIGLAVVLSAFPVYAVMTRMRPEAGAIALEAPKP